MAYTNTAREGAPTPLERYIRATYSPETAANLLDAYRDQVLTEAVSIASSVIGPLWHSDTLHEITDRIRAARTTTTEA